jgi:hypothetical protein
LGSLSAKSDTQTLKLLVSEFCALAIDGKSAAFAAALCVFHFTVGAPPPMPFLMRGTHASSFILCP